MKKERKEKSTEELIQAHVLALEAYNKADEASEKALEVSAKAFREYRAAADALKKRLAL